MESITLNKEEVYEVLKAFFPKQNDFSDSDYLEELNELIHFGIYTRKSLENLIRKHLETILKIDGSEIDEFHIKVYSDEFGKEYVEDKLRNKYWFAFPALLRLALELEFEDRYLEFSEQRNEI